MLPFVVFTFKLLVFIAVSLFSKSQVYAIPFVILQGINFTTSLSVVRENV